MKKICLLAVTAILTHACIAQAQFGLKAGVNFNHLKTSGSNDFAFKSLTTGFTIGSTVDLQLSDYFFVQPEFDFSYLNAHESFYGVTWRYSYFNVPVLLKYKIDKGRFGIYAGPQLGFLASASSKQNGIKTNIKHQLTSTDIAGVAGIDYKCDNGFRVDIRYQQSMLNLVKTEYSSPLKTRTGIFSFTVGYVFKCAQKN